MERGTIREATYRDAVFLAPRLREADRQECIAALGRPPEEVLPGAILDSLMTRTMVGGDGVPLGMFGVAPTPGMPLVGTVWMVATPGLLTHATQFLRESRAMVDSLHKVRPVLINLVDARNTVHIRWIEWMGFTLLATRPYGHAQLPFIEFAKVKH